MTHPFTDKAAEEFRKMDAQVKCFACGESFSFGVAHLCSNGTIVQTFRGADKPEPPFTLCERTVRACIEKSQAEPSNRRHSAFYNTPEYNAALNDVRSALESLLPKDRAKELVEEWFKSGDPDEGPKEYYDFCEQFARWLLTEKGAKL